MCLCVCSHLSVFMCAIHAPLYISVCMHMSVCIYVSMCVCVHVSVFVCAIHAPMCISVCMHVEARGQHWMSSVITSTLIFEVGSLTEPQVY